LSVRQVCGVRRGRPAQPSARVVAAVLDAYGIGEGARSRYRVDHLISVELGGASVSANLWPQPTSGKLGARQKDRAEAYLLGQVCRGKLSLRRAQAKLATNWVAVYRALPAGRKTHVRRLSLQRSGAA
jgi:hypothetical protein